MEDKELLELAAKAAGIELWHEDVFTNGLTQKVSDNGVLMWNPLLKDGDALQLVVKLNLHIAYGKDFVRICLFNSHAFNCDIFEEIGQNPYAATRRAIVRAAAEIGRSMK